MRLDQYLVLHGYAKSRSQASDLIQRGLVEVDGSIITKQGIDVLNPSIKMLEISRFVSRSGEKLMGAILDFKIDMRDKIAIDIGSSTGGFTDCALQHGVKFVYAYDVGHEQMDQSLRKDLRIELHEGTNILDVSLPDSDFIFIDVSFTSIKPIMKHIQGYKGEIIALIKPQFEAGNIHFKQGVLKDLKKHEIILYDVLNEVRNLGFSLYGLKKSALKGKTGNQEYVLYIKDKKNLESIDRMVRDALC